MEQNNIKRKFINFSIKNGKKINNIKKYNKLLFNLKKTGIKKTNLIIETVIKNLLIKIFLKSNIVKKHNNFSFSLLTPQKQINLAIKWLYKINNNEKELLREIINIYKNKNESLLIFKKKENYNQLKKLNYIIQKKEK